MMQYVFCRRNYVQHRNFAARSLLWACSSEPLVVDAALFLRDRHREINGHDLHEMLGARYGFSPAGPAREPCACCLRVGVYLGP